MAIKRKDGTTYRLQGPNPIMLRQEFWEEDSTVHNFEFPELVTNADGQVEIEYETYSPPEVVTAPPRKAAPPPPVEEEPVEEIIVTPKPAPPRTIAVPKDIPREPVWILPATVHEHRDPLYGEVRSQLRYGTKLFGEVILAGGDDLNMNVWTNGVELGRGSIIYLSNEQRWWRVQSITPKAGGFLYGCTPSDFQPAFE